MLPKYLSRYIYRYAFFMGKGYNLERPQSPFSFAKRVYYMKWLGENETSAEKYTLREIKIVALHYATIKQKPNNNRLFARMGNNNFFKPTPTSDNGEVTL